MFEKDCWSTADGGSFSLQVRCTFLDLLLRVKTLKDIHFIEVRHHRCSCNMSDCELIVNKQEFYLTCWLILSLLFCKPVIVLFFSDMSSGAPA